MPAIERFGLIVDRTLDKDLLAEEDLFLPEKVYRGATRHELVRIDYSNRFSDTV